MAKSPKDQKREPDEQQKREDDVLRRMLNTPPQPHQPKRATNKPKGAKPRPTAPKKLKAKGRAMATKRGK